MTSTKVKNRSLRALDFKPGQLPAGPAGADGARGPEGLQGPKGDACPPADPACRGPKGDTGDRGPGTLTFDGQRNLGGSDIVATVDDMNVRVHCASGTDDVIIRVQRTDNSHDLYGWGTQWDGNQLGRAEVYVDFINLTGSEINVFAHTTAELDVVAKSSPSFQAVKYTRFDISVVRGSKCNYHALVIPRS